MILLLVPAVFNLVVKLQVYTVYFITVTLAMVLILISLSLFFYPSLLYGYIWDYKGELEKIKIVNDTIDSNKKRDDVTEGIQEDEIKIYQNLEKHILSNKSFQQIGFTIHMLAQETDIPAYKISTIINGIAKTNFNSWLNIYRVNFFIQLIESGEGEKYTLDSLSQQCGFSSRTTLINSFKKQTGNTPGNYLRSLKSQKS
ncbi:helix-turn-helix domain-containing protein [Algoriphagus sp. oki45]|uniref:helix-turn-helix domain-containing protein n=1 Tax=Algoriphagus sp. oki45 TaxID=3067294 RepID=UPI0030C6F102